MEQTDKLKSPTGGPGRFCGADAGAAHIRPAPPPRADGGPRRLSWVRSLP